MRYSEGGPSTLILNIHALRSAAQQVKSESFVLEPQIASGEFVLDQGQNGFVRLDTGGAKDLKVTYRAMVETQVKLIPIAALRTVGVNRIDRNVIPGNESRCEI